MPRRGKTPASQKRAAAAPERRSGFFAGLQAKIRDPSGGKGPKTGNDKVKVKSKTGAKARDNASRPTSMSSSLLPLAASKSGPKSGAKSGVARGPAFRQPLVVAGAPGVGDIGHDLDAGSVNPKSAGAFRNIDRVLLVGEGNFSFAVGLCTRIGGSKIVASSLDTRQEVIEKYDSEAMGSLQALRLAGAKIHHGIDGTKEEDLRSCLGQMTAFDVVGFNFPHLGGATPEAVEANREMLRGFFKACKSVLAKSKEGSRSRASRVAVTLRATSFYESWGLEGLAADEGYKLAEKIPFDKSLYPGYQEARTNPAARASPGTEEAYTYVFVLRATSKAA